MAGGQGHPWPQCRGRSLGRLGSRGCDCGWNGGFFARLGGLVVGAEQDETENRSQQQPAAQER